MQIVLDLDPVLLQAVDKVARTENIDCSTLVNRLLEELLNKRKQLDLERDRRGYLAQPATKEELEDLEIAAAWLD